MHLGNLETFSFWGSKAAPNPQPNWAMQALHVPRLWHLKTYSGSATPPPIQSNAPFVSDITCWFLNT